MFQDQLSGSVEPSIQALTTNPQSSGNEFIDNNHFQLLCDAMPVPVLVLNHKFQVLVANSLCLELLGFDSLKKIVGTSFAFSSELEPKTGQCQNIFIDGVVLPLQNIRVDTKLITSVNEIYFVATITDLSRQKMHRSMEQLFFHDILNTAGGMHGISEILMEAEPEEVSDLQDTVRSLAAQLVNEITAQRDFVAAVNGELEVNTRRVQSSLLFRNLDRTYRNHPSTGQRHIKIKELNGPLQFISDPVLLNRVLGNMIKNALEASVYPEVVTMQSSLLNVETGKSQFVELSVHNPSYIQVENQDKIFQPSFSTKGNGRGLGTFSMRILTEKYLGGQVSFTTDPATGTTFSITLPLGGP